MLNRLIVSLALCVILLNLGCNPDYVKPGIYVEVHGKVLLDGGPVRNAKVVFVPEHLGLDDEFALSYGVTDSYGAFELKTSDQQEGALVGKHRVYISRVVDPAESSDDAKPTGGKVLDDEDFNFAQHREHVWDLIEESVEQPAGEQIPFYYNLKSELTIEVIPGRGIQRVEFDLSSVDPMLAR